MSKTVTLPYDEYQRLIQIFETAKDNIILLAPDIPFRIFQDNYGFENLDIPIPQIVCFGENEVTTKFNKDVEFLQKKLIDLRKETDEKNKGIGQWKSRFEEKQHIIKNVVNRMHTIERSISKREHKKLKDVFFNEFEYHKYGFEKP